MNQRATKNGTKKTTWVLVVLLSAGVMPARVQAQAPDQATGKPLSTDVMDAAIQAREAWRATRAATLRDDFGELGRYRDANAQLKPPAAGEKRVVFLGDSITDGWALEKYFPGKAYVNRGIGGQTTPQMLIRFREDVINLQPAVVVILAGTNDIAGNTGPMSLEEIEANYTSLAELGRVHGIRVVFSSILPVHNYTEKSTNMYAQRPMSKIRELNRWLQEYSKANGLVYLDYFSATVDDAGFLKKELAEDGLHPNAAGYSVLAPLAEAGIAKALGQ
jgi:lysophospholipase L1-like esterase